MFIVDDNGTARRPGSENQIQLSANPRLKVRKGIDFPVAGPENKIIIKDCRGREYAVCENSNIILFLGKV